MQGESHLSLWRHWQGRLRAIGTPRVLRKACLAAVVVGGILVLINQGDVFFSGQVTGQVIVRSLLTPIIPFCVTMLGALLNSGTARRPAW